MVGHHPALRRAYAHCERMAGEHYENFPVASRLLPSTMRPHIAAIYAFARRADDFADEPGIPQARRHWLLDDWGERLQACVSAPPGADDDDDALVFAALGHSIRTRELPMSLFEDLLSAFRQDVTRTRYETWTELLDYCRRSANPVGRLVLRVAGVRDSRADCASDAVCTALQLTNFWQDLGRDFAAGRLYVPLEDMARAGALEGDLAADRVTAEWRRLLGTIVARTDALFDQGRGIGDAVTGRLRWELRLTWLGGRRILDKVAVARQASFVSRPTLGWSDAPGLLGRALLWRRAPAPPLL